MANSQITFRPLETRDQAFMSDFLYECIFVPEGQAKPPRDILNTPNLQVYIQGFGEYAADCGVIAESEGSIVGMAWARVMNDYGHIDDDTPSIAISVQRTFRGRGIGSTLLELLKQEVRAHGFSALSLSVQAKNSALRLYRRHGFQTVQEKGEDLIMRCAL